MSTTINSILIPTDFSDNSESALKVGIAIAKRQNAEITLLHVLDTYSYLRPSEVFLPGAEIIQDLKQTMEVQLNKIALNIQYKSGIATKALIMSGSPADCICRSAFNNKISLIVMGTHGDSGLREFFIGSDTYKVVKNAACPVLTIPGNWNKTFFERVLFPIRLYPNALEKYFFARPIIEKNNSELILLGLAEKKKPDDVKEIALLMDRLKYQLHNDNVVFQSLLCPCENFPEKVINSANEHNTDLIILTANLDTNFRSFFVGPFVQRVVNHARRPVLSIKPEIIQTKKTNTIAVAESWGSMIDFSDFEIQAP